MVTKIFDGAFEKTSEIKLFFSCSNFSQFEVFCHQGIQVSSILYGPNNKTPAHQMGDFPFPANIELFCEF